MRIDRRFMEQWGFFYLLLLVPIASLLVYCLATGAFSSWGFSWRYGWQLQWLVFLSVSLVGLIAFHIYVARREALPGDQSRWLGLRLPSLSLAEGMQLCATPRVQSATSKITQLLARIDFGTPEGAQSREVTIADEEFDAVARPVDVSAARLMLLGHPVDRISLLALTHLFLCSTDSAKETPETHADWLNGILAGYLWQSHQWDRDEFCGVPCVDLSEHWITGFLTDRGSFLLEMKHGIRLTHFVYTRADSNREAEGTWG